VDSDLGGKELIGLSRRFSNFSDNNQPAAVGKSLPGTICPVAVSQVFVTSLLRGVMKVCFLAMLMQHRLIEMFGGTPLPSLEREPRVEAR
jgi:hypothetical protein